MYCAIRMAQQRPDAQQTRSEESQKPARIPLSWDLAAMFGPKPGHNDRILKFAGVELCSGPAIADPHFQRSITLEKKL
jgi:hypothetical protein